MHGLKLEGPDPDKMTWCCWCVCECVCVCVLRSKTPAHNLSTWSNLIFKFLLRLLVYFLRINEQKFFVSAN